MKNETYSSHLGGFARSNRHLPTVVSSRQGARSDAVLFAAGIIAASICVSWLSEDFFVSWSVLWAVAVIFLGSAPMFVLLWRRQWRAVPLLELNGLYYVLSMGIPGLLDDGHLEVGRGWEDKGLALTLLGLGALYFGYYIVGGTLRGRIRPIRMGGVPTGSPLLLFGLALETLYLLYSYISVEYHLSIPSISQLVPLLGDLGKVFILFFVLSRKSPSFLRSLAFILGIPLLLMDAVFNLTSGLLFQAFPLFVILVLSWRQFRGGIPRSVIVLAALVFMFLNQGKVEYRKVYWGAVQNGSGSIFSRMADMVNFSSEKADDTRHSVRESIENVVLRLDAATLFGRVLQLTPQVIPYSDGATLKPALYIWIPRILWPGKPKQILGNEWGRRYGLLDPGDYVTSLNLPWIIEFYINFGIVGLALCMMVVGVLFRFLLLLLNCDVSPQLLSFAVATAVTVSLWYAESNFVLMWGTVFQGILALVLFLKFWAPQTYARSDGKASWN